MTDKDRERLRKLAQTYPTYNLFFTDDVEVKSLPAENLGGEVEFEALGVE